MEPARSRAEVGRPLVLKKPSRDHGAWTGSLQARMSQRRTPECSGQLYETENCFLRWVIVILGSLGNLDGDKYMKR